MTGLGMLGSDRTLRNTDSLRVPVEDSIDVLGGRERVLAGEVSDFTVCPTRPEAHLIEADFESTIENRDERNQLLTRALRNGREECLVLGWQDATPEIQSRFQMTFWKGLGLIE